MKERLLHKDSLMNSLVRCKFIYYFLKNKHFCLKKYHFFLIFSMNLMFLLAICLFFITNG
jgi:hypothetical protein